MSTNWVEVYADCYTESFGALLHLDPPNNAAGGWTSSPAALTSLLNKTAKQGNVVTNFSHLHVSQDKSTPPFWKKFTHCAVAVLSFTKSSASFTFRVEKAELAVLTPQDVSVGWLELKGGLWAVIRRNPKVARKGIRVEGLYRSTVERGGFTYLYPSADNFRTPAEVVKTLNELAKLGSTATSVLTYHKIQETTVFATPRFDVTSWGIVGWMADSGYVYSLRELDRSPIALADNEIGVGVIDIGGPLPRVAAHLQLVTRRPL